MRAQCAPYPSAYCFHRGGTPGRIFYREGDGVTIFAGTEARRGKSKALLVKEVRTADGVELKAHEYFKYMGGYLTSRP